MTTYSYYCVIDQLHRESLLLDGPTYEALSAMMDQNPMRFIAIRLVHIESAEPLSDEELSRRLMLLCDS
jgi:hypothetical protein